jgi:hypothetical protein
VRQTCDQKGHIPFLDTFEVLRKEIERDFCIVFAADFLGIKVPLSERTKGECQLEMRMAKDFVGEVEDGPGHFVVVQMREELISPELGLIPTRPAIQALIVVQFDE